ncbi:hypothetical protein CCMSSC00406_0009125 [Pleurotus cornucopiae]|uniref:Uncharacterized protein n=1 Tax=Pleurotus cornucopiae TaxID=5321 RepID=A0ACB7JD79_PLECO|nr:hypothetical protein CCMSSC00406_0009125 [Pleurotus cornucopiae]
MAINPSSSASGVLPSHMSPRHPPRPCTSHNNPCLLPNQPPQSPDSQPVLAIRPPTPLSPGTACTTLQNAYESRPHKHPSSIPLTPPLPIPIPNLQLPSSRPLGFALDAPPGARDTSVYILHITQVARL